MALSDQWAGLRDGAITVIPIGFAVAPVALVYGALAIVAGMSPAEAVLSSAIVFAGAAQFVSLEIWDYPVPIAGLVLAAFLINLRHILMGVALTPHLPKQRPLLCASMLFFMVDEAWVLALRRAMDKGLGVGFYFGMGLSLYCIWIIWTALGTLAGSVIGDPQKLGLDFAFVAIFIALVGGFWTGKRSAVIWLTAGAASCVAKVYVPGAWYVMIGGLSGMAMAALLWQPGDGVKSDGAP